MSPSDIDSMEVLETEASERMPHALGLTLLALALGLVVQALFFDQTIGLNFPIWVMLSISALFAAAWRFKAWPAKPALLLTGLVPIFAWLTWLRAEPLTLTLSILSTLALLTLLVGAFRRADLIRFGWLDLGWTFLRVPLEAWLQPWASFKASWRQVEGEFEGRGQGLPLLRGALLALPIVVLFTLLLSSADLVFADFVRRSFDWLQIERLPEWIARGFLACLAAIFSLGSMVIAIQNSKQAGLIREGNPLLQPFLGFTEAAVVLVAVNLTFLAFVVIQFTYLFGGDANVTNAGYTYSEYARRGFGELVAVSFLSLGLILALAWATRHERRAWFKGLGAILVLLIGAILASALKRLLLYETAYGFTRLRTYTHVAILWMAVAFAIFLILLLADRLQFIALASLFLGLGFNLSLGMMNVDLFIVRQNAARYQESEAIDLDYLASLSDDAVPGLLALLDELNVEPRRQLLSHLACRQARIKNRLADAGWQSSNRPSTEAAELLDGLENSEGCIR